MYPHVSIKSHDSDTVCNDCVLLYTLCMLGCIDAEIPRTIFHSIPPYLSPTSSLSPLVVCCRWMLLSEPMRQLDWLHAKAAAFLASISDYALLSLLGDRPALALFVRPDALLTLFDLLRDASLRLFVVQESLSQKLHFFQ